MRAGGTRGKSRVHPDLALLLRSLSPQPWFLRTAAHSASTDCKNRVILSSFGGLTPVFLRGGPTNPAKCPKFHAPFRHIFFTALFRLETIGPPARTRPDGLVERRCCVQRLVPCCLLRHHHLTMTKVALNTSASQGFRLPSDMLTTFSREERGRMVM